jgi:RNA polymerase sigma factor (sigma-70 family)
VADASGQYDWEDITQGDPDTWREFLSYQIPLLYEMFIKCWSNPSLAEELVQRTVFDAIKGRSTYNPSRASPDRWIVGIARNNIRLEMRKRASQPSVNGDIDAYMSAIDTELLPNEVLEMKETALAVRTTLSKLQTSKRNVLMAKYIQGFSARQIAQQMDITEKAVHSLLYRARKSFREEIGRIFNNKGRNYETSAR